MAKQYTSKQIAAHIADNYINNGNDTDFVAAFEKDLALRIPVLRKSGNTECYQDVCSMLYCVRDMRSSCRDAGEHLSNGNRRESDRYLNRAAMRIREMGQLLIDIKKEHPEEYDRSCSGFVDAWRETEFERGKQFLTEEQTNVSAPQESQPKHRENQNAAPAAQMLSL